MGFRVLNLFLMVLFVGSAARARFIDLDSSWYLKEDFKSTKIYGNNSKNHALISATKRHTTNEVQYQELNEKILKPTLEIVRNMDQGTYLVENWKIQKIKKEKSNVHGHEAVIVKITGTYRDSSKTKIYFVEWQYFINHTAFQFIYSQTAPIQNIKYVEKTFAMFEPITGSNRGIASTEGTIDCKDNCFERLDVKVNGLEQSQGLKSIASAIAATTAKPKDVCANVEDSKRKTFVNKVNGGNISPEQDFDLYAKQQLASCAEGFLFGAKDIVMSVVDSAAEVTSQSLANVQEKNYARYGGANPSVKGFMTLVWDWSKAETDSALHSLDDYYAKNKIKILENETSENSSMGSLKNAVNSSLSVVLMTNKFTTGGGTLLGLDYARDHGDGAKVLVLSLLKSVKDYLSKEKNEYLSCLNESEQAKYICRTAVDVALLAGGLNEAVLGLAKGVSKGGDILSLMRKASDAALNENKITKIPRIVEGVKKVTDTKTLAQLEKTADIRWKRLDTGEIATEIDGKLYVRHSPDGKKFQFTEVGKVANDAPPGVYNITEKEFESLPKITDATGESISHTWYFNPEKESGKTYIKTVQEQTKAKIPEATKIELSDKLERYLPLRHDFSDYMNEVSKSTSTATRMRASDMTSELARSISTLKDPSQFEMTSLIKAIKTNDTETLRNYTNVLKKVNDMVDGKKYHNFEDAYSALAKEKNVTPSPACIIGVAVQ